MTKKVLVTGAAGFIGSHLCEHLVKAGYQVKAFVRYNSRGDRGWLDHSPLAKEIEFVVGDIRDFDAVTRGLEGCSGVFHLAALIGIPYSYVSPLAYIKTNVEGTYNVLEAGRQKNLSKILVTSTSEVYGTARQVPIREDHPLQPQSPYSASKIGADQLSLSYHLSFNSPVVIARPFNTYGPRQSARAVIPTIISQLLAGKKQIKLGNLTPTRDLVFVEETARGMREIYECDALVGRATNIGTGSEITIGDLAKLIGREIGKEFEFEEDAQRVRPGASEVERLLSDPSVLKEKTGWKPSVPVAEGIRKTIAWFRDHLAKYRPDEYAV
jgi:NAD dependent epimerase/dehydratase